MNHDEVAQMMLDIWQGMSKLEIGGGLEIETPDQKFSIMRIPKGMRTESVKIKFENQNHGQGN